jgi:hypothetical protein
MGTQALPILQTATSNLRMGQMQRAHHPHRRHTGKGSVGIQAQRIEYSFATVNKLSCVKKAESTPTNSALA